MIFKLNSFIIIYNKYSMVFYVAEIDMWLVLNSIVLM